jgi:preprotein translocase subunit SecD
MEGTSTSFTFCPDKIFDRLDRYFTQVLLLDSQQISNPKKIESRTLGSITISESLGQKKIEIVKNSLVLYCAEKDKSWKIVENQLDALQISTIETLPQTKEEIYLEFYGRKLTLKLKDIFQKQKYPLERRISLNQTQVPYKFYISRESTPDKIIFVGINRDEDLIFKSSFDNHLVKVIKNNLSLEHLNHLSCQDF